MSPPAPSDPVRVAPPALWRVAAAFLQTLHALFGAPERVAFLHTLTAKQHALMAGWLRAGEALMRRLLLIEASAFPKPNTRPLLHARRSRTRKLMTFSAEHPEAWRVSFRMFTPSMLRQAQHDAEGGAAGSVSVSLSLSKAERPDRPFVFREDRRAPPKRTPRAKRANAATQTRGKRLLRQDRVWMLHEPKLRFRSAWPLAERYEALLRVFTDPAPYAHRLSRRLHATPHRLAEALRAPPEAQHRVVRLHELTEAARARWRARFSSA